MPTNATVTAGSLQGEYYLLTQVIGNGSVDKNDLYVSGYHTGAGTNDVTLGGVDVASKGYFNGTHQQFDYETSFPWGLSMGGDTNYAAWELAMIDGGEGSEGFFFNSSGLQWNETYEGFGGWLACDWWHGVPQLFWKNAFYDNEITAYPSSCASINLLAVTV
ncbi:hypothetical protein ACLMJK_002265 [Lecanora helva]